MTPRFVKIASLVAILLASLSALPVIAADHPTIVLVHGAFETGKVWDKTKAALEARGFHTKVVELPGRSTSPQKPETVTLNDYKQAILAAMKDEKAPVVLVGHSFGGIQISNVAEDAPTRVKKLVYLAALLPKDGDSLDGLFQHDIAHKLKPTSFQVATDKATASIAREDRVMLFCLDCRADQQAVFPDTMVAEPFPPLGEAVHLTEARFGSVPRAYIYTTQDNILSYPFQQEMVARAGVNATFSIDSSHSPFLSQPEQLAQTIIKASE